MSDSARATGFPYRFRRFRDRLAGRRRKWFVSHSYQDAAAVEALRTCLPRTVEPFVFPPIEVKPDEAVSDSLVQSMGDCDGLIFIASPVSEASFWVNFERRFAIRIHTDVVSFDPARRAFARFQSRVGNSVAVLWNASLPGDNSLGLQIARWLQENRRVYTERLFETWYETDNDFLVPDATVDTAPQFGEDDYSLRTKVQRHNASVVVLVSNATLRAPWPFNGGSYLLEAPPDGKPAPHVEVVWLEPPDERQVRAAINARAIGPREAKLCDLVLRSAGSPHRLVVGTPGGIDRNRLDDLLIRLEHAAFVRGSLDGPNRAETLKALRMHASFKNR